MKFQVIIAILIYMLITTNSEDISKNENNLEATDNQGKIGNNTDGYKTTDSSRKSKSFIKSHSICPMDYKLVGRICIPK